MAMRPRSGVTPNRPPRPVARRVYEDFTPVSEWRQGDEADILIVHLPGFIKEQLNITTESQNMIRIRGESPVGPNQWSRFQEDFQVPENCSLDGIRANFEGRILYVTMPRKSFLPAVPPAKTVQKSAPAPQNAIDKPWSPQDTSTSGMEKQDSKIVQPPSPPKIARAPRAPQRRQDDTASNFISSIDDDKQTDGKSLEAARPQKVTSEPSPQKGPDDTPKFISTIGDNQKQIDGKNLEAPSFQKVTSESRPPKLQEDTPLKLIPATGGVQKQTDEKSIKSTGERKASDETKAKPAESEMPENAMGKKSIDKSKEPIEADSIGEKIVDRRKEKRVGAAGTYEEKAGEMKRTTRSVTVPGGGAYTLENYKQVVKKLAKRVNEERRLVVNMVVAVLVIVALGAYVSYTFGTSGKAEP